MLKLTEMVQLGALGYKPADIKKLGESGIETKDIIELAKSGYSSSDVDELVKMAQEANNTATESNEGQSVPAESASTAGGDGASDDNIKTDPDPRDSEIEKLKEEISKMQDANASKNIGQTKTQSNEELVREAFKNLY